MPNSTCRETHDRATRLAAGEGGLWDTLWFRLHLLRCPPCRAYLAQMKKTIEVLTQMPGEPVPEPVREELTRLFRDWADKRDDERDD